MKKKERVTLTLEHLLDAGEEQARKVMIGSTEQLVPLFHLVRKDGQQAVLGTPFADAKEKQKTLWMMKYIVQGGDVLSYMFCSEVWMAQQDHSWRDGDTMPSTRDDRFEAVIIQACDRDTEKMRLLAIKRDEAGKCIALDIMPEEKIGGGAFANLFKE